MQLLPALFGFVGLTGIVWLWKRGRRGYAYACAQWHGRHGKKDFYFRRLEIAIRWDQLGRKYTALRRGQIVCREKGHDTIPYGVGPLNIGQFTLQVPKDAAYSVKEAETIPGKNSQRFEIKFDTPSKKRRERRPFEYCINGVAHKHKMFPSHLSSTPIRRVDELVLRVVFVDLVPTRAWFSVLDSDGRPANPGKPEEELEIHPISREAKKKITHARLGWILHDRVAATGTCEELKFDAFHELSLPF